MLVRVAAAMQLHLDVGTVFSMLSGMNTQLLPLPPHIRARPAEGVNSLTMRVLEQVTQSFITAADPSLGKH